MSIALILGIHSKVVCPNPFLISIHFLFSIADLFLCMLSPAHKLPSYFHGEWFLQHKFELIGYSTFHKTHHWRGTTFTLQVAFMWVKLGPTSHSIMVSKCIPNWFSRVVMGTKNPTVHSLKKTQIVRTKLGTYMNLILGPPKT